MPFTKVISILGNHGIKDRSLLREIESLIQCEVEAARMQLPWQDIADGEPTETGEYLVEIDNSDKSFTPLVSCPNKPTYITMMYIDVEPITKEVICLTSIRNETWDKVTKYILMND